MTPPVGSAVTFSYNGYGAMTGDSTGRSFTWDALQRLTQMSAGGVTTTFSYDPLGRRTGLTQGLTSKTFFYDGLDLLSDGSHTYLNGQGLDHPLRLNDGSNNQYYLQNQLGSIARTTDATGASSSLYQYLPYGGLLSSSSALTGNPFTFTARENDGTGLLYYRARYYDPALQVFLSQDPLGDDQHYVGGNPLSFREPLGLDYWDFNFTGGYAGGVTFGVFYGQTSQGSSYTAHPYFGAGLTTPGVSSSANYSSGTIPLGCSSAQIGVEIGPIFGAVGKTLTGPPTKGARSNYWEAGLGWGSLLHLEYQVWGIHGL